MNSIFSLSDAKGLLTCCLGTFLLFLPFLGQAEIIEFVNGDRYTGKVIAINEKTIEFESEIQGRIQLPRDKIAVISLQETPFPRKTEPVKTEDTASTALFPKVASPQEIVQQMQKEGVSPEILNQVRQEILGSGNAESNQMFNDMVKGLMSGQLNVGDIRTQAESVVQEMNSLKKELGPEVGSVLDGYLSILENFLQQTEAPAGSSPKTPVAPSSPKN